MASADVEYRCFVGGLAWATDDQALEKAFSQFGDVFKSKIINDRETGRSRGFGFVTFGSEQSMKDAIEGMNGQDLDGRNITVNEAQSRGSGGGRGGGGFRSGGGGGYVGGRREGGGGFSRGGGGYGGGGGGFSRGRGGGFSRGGGGYGGGRGGYGAGGGGGGYCGGGYGRGDGIKAGKSELGGCRGYCGSKIGHCSPGRGSDRSAGGARSDRCQNLPVGDDKWNKGPGPFPSRGDQRADVGYGNTMAGFRSGSGGNSGVLRYPRGQVPGHHPVGILSGPLQLQPLNTSQRESKERDEYLQSKVTKQTSIDMKEETKAGIMGTNNSSVTIEVEQLERESKKSLTPSVGIEFSKTVEVDLVPSAVFTGNHDTPSLMPPILSAGSSPLLQQPMFIPAIQFNTIDLVHDHDTTSDKSNLSNTVLELRDTASLSVAGSNDRAPLEMSRPKSATAKGKRQKKELLQKADAARSTSDLYTAYKGPENKELTLSTESSEGGSGCIDLKKLPADTKEGIKAGKSEAQVKSEPENREDAEDIRGEGSETAIAKASASASSFTSLFARGGEVAMGVLSNKVERDLIKPGDHIYSWRSAYIYAHHGIYAGDGKVIHFTRGAGQEIGTGTALDKFIFSSLPSHNPDYPCPNCGDQSRLDDVICSCLDCFLAGGDLYLFEYDVKVAFFLAKARGGTCTLAKSDPPEDVLHRASFLLENGFGVYHIFKNNCEDFAIYCKTGLLVNANIFSVPGSGQAASFVALATTVMSSPRIRFLTTNFGGLAVVGYLGGLAVVGAAMNCVSRLASDMGVRRDVVKVAVETLVAFVGTRK